MTNLKADGAAVVLVERVKHVMRVGAGICKKNVHKYQGVKEFHMLARKVTGEMIDVGDGPRGFYRIPETHWSFS